MLFEVKNFLATNSVNVVGLLETKIKMQKAPKIQQKLGNKWKWIANYNHHEKGRVWVGWRHDQCKVEECKNHQQFIVTKITPINTSQNFHIVFIYGMHSVRDRRSMWQELDQIDFNSPCLYIGDYNAIYKKEHRKNGSQVTTYETHDMMQWLENNDLHPIRERGHYYS